MRFTMTCGAEHLVPLMSLAIEIFTAKDTQPAATFTSVSVAVLATG